MLFVSFKSTLINYLLGQSTLMNLVGSRLYFANPATVEFLAYPAATFLLAEGNDFLGIVRDFPMQAFTHSDQHFDEAHQVMDIIAIALDGVILGNACAVRVTGNPTENYVINPRLYNVNLPLHVTLL